MSKQTEKRERRAVSESIISATWKSSVTETAVLVGVGPGMTESRLDELAALASTAGAEPVARLVQSREAPDPATYVGRGKVAEIKSALGATGAGVVVFDAELSPGQLRTLEERLGVKVIDRTALILDIFALHATSREGKTQVELAQLNYLLPRLRGWGEAMSRLGGGIGTRGPGETKLETDRQHIRRRITKLRRETEQMAKTRSTKRAQRERSGISQVALAGYTNSGKSTLMNMLTDAGVLVADQLFATLDPTVRRLALPSGRGITLSDTVGFVSKLPHELVEAFRSTLEDVATASTILHVADASNPNVDAQIRAVQDVLSEIGAGDIPEVLVLNKGDRVAPADLEQLQERYGDAVVVSSVTGLGRDTLLAALDGSLPHFPIEVTFLVPYERGDVVARLYRDSEVHEQRRGDAGTWIKAHVGERVFRELREFVDADESSTAS